MSDNFISSLIAISALAIFFFIIRVIVGFFKKCPNEEDAVDSEIEESEKKENLNNE